MKKKTKAYILVEPGKKYYYGVYPPTKAGKKDADKALVKAKKNFNKKIVVKKA